MRAFKSFPVLLLLVLLMLVLSTTAFAETKNLKIWVFQSSASTETFTSLAKEYEATHPDVKIKFESFNLWDYESIIRTAIAGNEAPDMFTMWAARFTGDYARSGAVIDLTDAFNRRNMMSRFSKASLSEFTFNNVGGKDSRVYAAPLDMMAHPGFFNVKLFKSLGLTDRFGHPDTWSWDDFQEACKILKQKGIYPIAFGDKETGPGMHVIGTFFINYAGRDLWEKMLAPQKAGEFPKTGDPSWVQDPFKQGFNLFVQMQKDGYFTPTPNAATEAQAWTYFLQGRAAMVFTGTWALDPLDKGKPSGFEYDVFRWPPMTGGPRYIEGGAESGLCISKQCVSRGNLDASLDFMDWLTSVSIAKKYAKGGQLISSVAAANTKETLTNPALLKVSEWINSPNFYAWTNNWISGGEDHTIKTMVQLVLQGDKTPDDAVKELQKVRLDEVKRLGVK